MQTRYVRRPDWMTAGTVLTLLVGAGACGNVTPGGIGEARISVTGNVPSPPPAPAPVSFVAGALGVSGPGPADSIPEADNAEGKVRACFTITIVSESGFETRLGDREIQVEVDLQGADEPEVVAQMVTANRYTALRITFTEIRAEVAGGLVINGQPIVGELRVELEDLTLPITRAIDLDVADGDSVQLVIDLNAPAWLTAVDPITLTVNERVFADLINVVSQ